MEMIIWLLLQYTEKIHTNLPSDVLLAFPWTVWYNLSCELSLALSSLRFSTAQLIPFEIPSFPITIIVKHHKTRTWTSVFKITQCLLCLLWQVPLLSYFWIYHILTSFLLSLGLGLTWWVSQWGMEHREVYQSIGRQEEIGDDGGNGVQLSYNEKTEKSRQNGPELPPANPCSLKHLHFTFVILKKCHHCPWTVYWIQLLMKQLVEKLRVLRGHLLMILDKPWTPSGAALLLMSPDETIRWCYRRRRGQIVYCTVRLHIFSLPNGKVSKKS